MFIKFIQFNLFQLIFTPGHGGKRKASFLPKAKYDWSNSHGAFREMVGMESKEKWVEKFNKTSETINQQQECRDSQSCTQKEEKFGSDHITPPTQSKESTQIQSKEMEFQNRTSESEIGKYSCLIINNYLQTT